MFNLKSRKFLAMIGGIVVLTSLGLVVHASGDTIILAIALIISLYIISVALEDGLKETKYP